MPYLIKSSNTYEILTIAENYEDCIRLFKYKYGRRKAKKVVNEDFFVASPNEFVIEEISDDYYRLLKMEQK